jgi:hypothetical protein
MKYVYRGVHAGHPILDEAKRGNVVPGDIRGKVTPEDHNKGGVAAFSPFTSWTADQKVAEFYADKFGPGGVVLRLPGGNPQAGDTWSWEWSPDRFGEQEILLRGKRSGATVIPR